MGDQNSLALDFASNVLRHVLVDSGKMLHRKTQEVERDWETISSRILEEGLPFLTVALPKLGKTFDAILSKDDTHFTPAGWTTREGFPVFMNDVWGKIFAATEDCSSEGDYKVAILPDADPLAVRTVRQICYLSYKLELAFSEAVTQEKLDAFVELDKSLPLADEDVVLSRQTRMVIDNARILIARIFDSSCESSEKIKAKIDDHTIILSSFDPSDIIPRHGPGAVSTGERVHEKYSWKRWYRKLDEEYPYSDYFYFNYEHMWERFDDLNRLKVHETGTAKVCLVPKDSRGPRLISMEPLEYQWIQQGLGRKIVSWLESHPLSRGYVNFTSQDINRALALSASKNQRFETLDMKDASDRVSLWLVSKLFPKRLLRKLIACRTTHTILTDGRVVELRKFAPMGSALCFPVESLVFWALATAIIDPYYTFTPKDVIRRGGVYVFGDDLIVPRGTFDQLKDVFKELHLEFNEDKCCTGKYFRESCGLDAFSGEVVTPIRLKRFDPSSPRALLSICSYANAFNQIGYFNTSRYLFEIVEERCGKLPLAPEGELPLSRWCSSEVRCLVHNLRHLKWRVNTTLQRIEYRIWQPKSHAYVWGDADWEALFRTSIDRSWGTNLEVENELEGLFSLQTAFSRSRRKGFIQLSPPPGQAYQPCTYTRLRDVKLRQVWTSV